MPARGGFLGRWPGMENPPGSSSWRSGTTSAWSQRWASRRSDHCRDRVAGAADRADDEDDDHNDDALTSLGGDVTCLVFFGDQLRRISGGMSTPTSEEVTHMS